MSAASFVVRPIGVARTPFADKASAPRQAVVAAGTEGRIELYPGEGIEHALEDLASWDRLWVLFWFHLAEGFRPKVLPPRSAERRGLFATRSPHRPNPIGMSAVRLVRVEGLVVHVQDLDLVDGTPVLDIKPYVAYADAFPESGEGWLEARDPKPAYRVGFAARAEEQLDFVKAALGLDLRAALCEALALGPAPHPYRRIRKEREGASRIAWKDWRARFVAEGLEITVLEVKSGYRPKELQVLDGPAGEAHRAFVGKFG